MLGFATAILLLGILNLINHCAAQPTQVGLALRSDSIVLVQLASQKKINYAIQVDVDQDYQDFMAMMRHDQTNLPYFDEYMFYLQKYWPIYNRTLTYPVQPVTNLHYAHALARNIRPLIKQAESKLGSIIKCDAIVIPVYTDINDYTPFVQLASELAGCGSIGGYQIKSLYDAILWAYDLGLIDGKRQMFRPEHRKDMISILLEIEPSHIRISAINVMPMYVVPMKCASICDRTDSTPIETLLLCIKRFRKACVVDDKTFDFHSHPYKIGAHEIRMVFLSGRMESHRSAIVTTIDAQFGITPLDGTTLGMDAELLGAYGAAYWASFSREHEYKRDLNTWNMPMFSGIRDYWYNGTMIGTYAYE